ncbi:MULTISPECIES: SPOR domain-containing protein [Pseudoalteromonas]|uniref:SPOR domain-containing protein n=1 Tax=Pseudoalteromonas TaxID=53246 RepID=UPI0018CCCFB2|nr:SPOR domain-containing protein [Pseudoalteromonas sp. NSLLW24]MBG9997760.1 SPOR domain-containing protein [Pseudoalteromonas sp. NSLLW24]
MVFNQLKYFILLFGFVVWLMGCSSQNADTKQLDDMVRMQEIKPYLEQWDNSKDKINRLSDIEEDLLMLIQALSLQSDLKALPESMRTEAIIVEHGSIDEPNKSSHQESVMQVPIYAVQLGSFLKKELATVASQNLKINDPLIFNSFLYKVNTLKKPNIVLYQLIAGPFKTPQHTQAFCQILSQIDLPCKPTLFEGEDV